MTFQNLIRAAILLLSGNVFFLAACLGAPPFREERLQYSLAFMAVRVGTGTLTATRADGQLRITAQGDSNRFFSAFYNIHDKITTACQPESYLPVRYDVDFNEGSYHRRCFYLFDWPVLLSRGENRQVKLEPETYDPLSGFFLIRTQPMTPGTDVVRFVTDGRRLYRLVLHVLARKNLHTRFGPLKCLEVEPDLCNIQFEGVMREKGRIFIYLTDDEFRVPVYATGRVLFGSVQGWLQTADPETLKNLNRLGGGKNS